MKSSPRQVAWLMLTEPEVGRAYLERLYRESPLIAATASSAREFARIMRNRNSAAWHGVLIPGILEAVTVQDRTVRAGFNWAWGIGTPSSSMLSFFRSLAVFATDPERG